MRKSRAKVLLIFFSIVFAFALGELAIRLQHRLKVKGMEFEFLMVGYWVTEEDPFLGFRMKPNLKVILSSGSLFDTNSEGFRDVEIPVEDSKPRRLIICIGESSTWGIGVGSNFETYPKRLEALLRRKSKDNIVVLNAGIPGYTTVENLNLIRLRLIKYKPEAIVYMGFRNDGAYYAHYLDEKKDLNFYPTQRLADAPSKWYNDLTHTSMLLFAFQTTLRSFFQTTDLQAPKKRTYATMRGKELFVDNIALIAALCKKHNIRLLWVDQVVRFIGESGEYASAIKELRELLKLELAKQSVPLLEAQKYYDEQPGLFLDDVHYSKEGNEWLAGILAPQIADKMGL